MCVFGYRADGVWLGSLEQFASSICTHTYTQEFQESNACHTYSSAAHMIKQRETNREHGHLWVTSTFFFLWLLLYPFPVRCPGITSSFLPLSSLCFPSSCEIAVVSYGFLFLRDGRWVHVGVEATKHAVSAQRAGQHMWWASCGYDSCHVHIAVLPVVGECIQPV